jgi:hypothetical protein
MDICADGGTYIKEFVHGDRCIAVQGMVFCIFGLCIFLFADSMFLRGRTVPNLHDALLCDADILQLDVIAVGEVIDGATTAVCPEVAAQQNGGF